MAESKNTLLEQARDPQNYFLGKNEIIINQFLGERRPFWGGHNAAAKRQQSRTSRYVYSFFVMLTQVILRMLIYWKLSLMNK